MNEPQLVYRCVRCSNRLAESENGSLACGTCRAQYPTTGKVRVLTFNPDRLLRTQLGRVAARRAEIATLKSKLGESRSLECPPEALSKALLGYDRSLAHLDVLEQLLQPVRDYLASTPASRSPLDDLLFQSGWPSFKMLTYFFRDWAGTAETAYVTDLFTNAIQRHQGGHHRGGIAILGCGAGRLAYDLSVLFPVVFGVELAVDSLLLTQAVLEGTSIDLHFNFPDLEIPIDQPSVRIQRPARKADNIELVAADVSRLPFCSSTLQCVTTQYLLDIVPNPTCVYREINRVLAPGGLWINFSNLSKNSRPDTFEELSNLDLFASFRRYGFTLLEEAVHRFAPLDLSTLSRWAPVKVETPVFSVSRKDQPVPEPRDEVAGFFAERDERVWSLVPQIIASVQVCRRRIFSPGGVKTVVALDTSWASRSVTSEMARFSESILQMIDGTRSLRALFGAAQAHYGCQVPESDFLTLFCELADLGLIVFSSP